MEGLLYSWPIELNFNKCLRLIGGSKFEKLSNEILEIGLEF